MSTFQIQRHHHGPVLQPVDHFTFISPIILQGDLGDDQRGVHRGRALQVDATVETPVTPLVVIHGHENIHLQDDGEKHQ